MMQVLLMTPVDRNFLIQCVILIIVVVYIFYQYKLITKTKELFRPADQAFSWETKMRLFENAVTAIVAIDQDDRVVAWNTRAEEFFGYTEKEMLGKDMADHIIPLKYRDMHKRGLEQYVRTRKPSKLIDNGDGIELEALRKNGKTFPIRLYLGEFETKEGFLSFGAWIVDITAEVEKRKKQNHIIEQHEHGEEMANIGWWCYSIITNKVEGSKGFCKIFSVKPGDELTYDNLMSRIYYKDKQAVTDALLKAIETNTGYTIEYRIFRTDGSLFMIRATAIPQLDDSGRVTEFKGLIQYLNEVKDAT